MKAVKDAKRQVSGRGRTGRDGAIDLALKMEDSAVEAAAIDEHIYRVIEIVGSSPRSIEGAIEAALARADRTLRNLRWFEVLRTSPSYSVRPDGAYHQWRKIPPRELLIDLVADERFVWATERAEAS